MTYNYQFIVLIILAVSGHSFGTANPCSSGKRDVVFALDSSDFISEGDFKCAKKFYIKTISLMKEANPENRFALVTFGDNATLVFDFEKYTNLEDITKSVKEQENGKGHIAIGKTLKLISVKLRPTMREDSIKMVILLTAGTNDICPSPHLYAQRLKDSSVGIITIGIGSKPDPYELIKIASPKRTVGVEDVHSLFKSYIEIIGRICMEIEPIPKKSCKLNEQDFVILLDSTESITQEEYGIVKSFIRKLLSVTEIGSDKVRVAMVSFSDEIRYDFDFDLTDKNKMFEIVDSLQTFGSATGIGLALQETLAHIKSKQRPLVPFNVLLITDGKNNMFPTPINEAELLKDDGADIMALGIGDGINLNELKAISSKDNVITVKSYNALKDDLKTIVKIVNNQLNSDSEFIK